MSYRRCDVDHSEMAGLTFLNECKLTRGLRLRFRAHLCGVPEINETRFDDPAAMKVISRYKLSGIENLHGISLDQTDRLAFIAGEENHSFAVIDLKTMKLLTVHQIGEVPNVLAFDPSLKNLYISANWGPSPYFKISRSKTQPDVIG